MVETVMTANVNYLVLLILPFFSGMINDFFQSGMAFSRYGDFLYKEIREEKEMPKWKKPIGGCLKCFHVWVCIVWIVASTHLHFDIVKFILFLSLSYYILTNRYYE